jgi:hypothetical protein
MFDNLIKLYQLETSELSGFIVELIDDFILTTGVTYNTYINSGAVLTGQTGNFIDINHLNSTVASINLQNSFTYYPLTNPSGFITTGYLSGALANFSGGSGGNINTGNFVTTGQTGVFITTGKFPDLIDVSQKIGINTLTPQYQLDIYGTPNAVIGNSNGDICLVGSNNGVGINQINPQYTLDVGGEGNFGTNILISGISIYDIFYPYSSNPSGYIKSLNTVSVTSGIVFITGSPYPFGLFSVNIPEQSVLLGDSIGSVNETYLDISDYSQNIQINANNGVQIQVGSPGVTINGSKIIVANQTGAFYPNIGNPSGFILPSQTGRFVTTGQTGAFSSVASLQSLSGYIFNFNPWLVYTTGAQTISGAKTFVSPFNVHLSGGHLQLDNSNFALLDQNNVSSVNINTRNSIDANGVPSIDWTNRYLRDYTSLASLDWNNRLLLDNNLISSINWDNRLLLDNFGNISIDWKNKILSGNWLIQSATILSGVNGGGTGSFGFITGLFNISGASGISVYNTGNTIVINYTGNNSVFGNFNITGIQGITVAASGQNIIIGNTGGGVFGNFSVIGNDNLYVSGSGQNIYIGENIGTRSTGFYTILPSGINNTGIIFSHNIPSQPVCCICDIENNIDNSTYQHFINSVSTSGFNIYFSDLLFVSGYRLHTMVMW